MWLLIGFLTKSSQRKWKVTWWPQRCLFKRADLSILFTNKGNLLFQSDFQFFTFILRFITRSNLMKGDLQVSPGGRHRQLFRVPGRPWWPMEAASSTAALPSWHRWQRCGKCRVPVVASKWSKVPQQTTPRWLIKSPPGGWTSPAPLEIHKNDTISDLHDIIWIRLT